MQSICSDWWKGNVHEHLHHVKLCSTVRFTLQQDDTHDSLRLHHELILLQDAFARIMMQPHRYSQEGCTCIQTATLISRPLLTMQNCSPEVLHCNLQMAQATPQSHLSWSGVWLLIAYQFLLSHARTAAHKILSSILQQHQQ